MRFRQMKSGYRLLLIFGAFGLYFFFSLVYLDLPGLYFDEVLFVNGAFGNLDGSFVSWWIPLFGRKIPLMLMEYIGALKAWIYAPLYAWLGTTAAVTRIPVILVGSATLALVYSLVRKVFSPGAATWCLLLIATDPTFIFANKLDWGPASLMLFLQSASLYLVFRWLTGSGERFLFGAAFLAGLGLFNKLIFVWYLGSLLIAFPVCFGPEIRRRLKLKTLGTAIGAFLIGCLPLLAFNVVQPLATFSHRSTITKDLREALRQRLDLFRTTLDGSAIYSMVNQASIADPEDPSATARAKSAGVIGQGLASLPAKPGLMPYAFLAALLVIPLLYWRKAFHHSRAVGFFALQLLLMALLIVLSNEAGGPHHAIAVYPLPHILTGYAISALPAAFGRGRSFGIKMSATLATLCGLAVVISHLSLDSRYVSSFAARGGVGNWSDAIYDLAAFAKQHPDKSFVLMDWGFNSQLLLLSGGQIKKDEAFVRFRDLPLDRKLEFLKAEAVPSDSYFVFHTPPFETSPSFSMFKNAIKKAGWKESRIRTFFQRDSRPVYAILQVVRAPEQDSTETPIHEYREAEECDSRSGGGIDPKGGATRGTALGNFWGRWPSDFAAYRFAAAANPGNAWLHIRYALGGNDAKQLFVLLDGEVLDVVTLPPTGGYGYSGDQWSYVSCDLGSFGEGEHEIRLSPAFEDQVVNLDCILISSLKNPPRDEKWNRQPVSQIPEH